jgi:predicted dehydrogenase
MHSRTLSRLAPGRHRYFASRDPEKARAFARSHDGAGAFESYQAALRHEAVEVAVVVTPPASHLEWTLAALGEGKHVIVEKPAFLRSADFDEVEAAAARADRRVLVAENYAYKPLARDLRWIFEGTPLGRVLFLQVNALKRQAVDGWRTDPALAAGGALFEGGIHWVSLLAHLGPSVRTVRAASPGSSGATDRSIQLLFEYDQGTVASLSYSWEVPSPLKGLRISRAYGTEGSALFESNGLFFATLGPPWRFRARGSDLLGYRAMFRDFLGVLEAGKEPRFTLADARRDVELVTEAYASAGLAPPGDHP